MTLQQLDEVGETTISQRLSQIDGVATVQVFGASKYAVRVQLDPVALAFRRIDIEQVATAIDAQNANVPTGTLLSPHTTYTLQASGQLQDAASFRSLTVTERNGTAVQLSQLGRVLDDVQNNQSASWFDGRRAGSGARRAAATELQHRRRRPRRAAHRGLARGTDSRRRPTSLHALPDHRRASSRRCTT